MNMNMSGRINGMLVLAAIVAMPAAPVSADVLGGGAPGAPATEPVPVTIQGNISAEVDVYAKAAITYTPNGWTDSDEAADFDSAVNGHAATIVYTVGFSHQYDEYGDTYADAGTEAYAEAWQEDADTAYTYAHIRLVNDGWSDNPLYVPYGVNTAQADAWASMRVDATANVPPGQPGQLIVDIQNFNLNIFNISCFWQLTIKDTNGASIADIHSDNDPTGIHEIPVIVGETYDVHHAMYGHDESDIPAEELDWQYISFTATGNVYEPPTPGDTNGDHLVDTLDYLNLVAQFGGAPGANSADFNNDGIVDLTDFAVIRGNWGFGTAPPAAPGAGTPEPATMTLLAIGSLSLLRRRRRRS